MISFVKGTIQSIDKDSVVVETAGGVGYKIYLSKILSANYTVGEKVSFFTYLKVSDSALDLYGFANHEQKEFFELLLTVSGVGPKSAMNILNLGSLGEIKGAIVREDIKYLTAIQGMGQKTAERLVVELKSKIKNQKSKIDDLNGEIMYEVIEGLTSMGYSREEAKTAVKSVELKGKTTEEVLRLALRKLSR